MELSSIAMGKTGGGVREEPSGIQFEEFNFEKLITHTESGI